MEFYKRITWIVGENPKRDGKYLVAYGTPELGINHILGIHYVTTDDYTVEYGWGTCPFYDMEMKGQHPEGMRAWAEFPF